ncbi:MAG TPA: hypothetical protein VLY24_11115 [Bryobacteraceae bacterium]|nr:hypothetical protein [Bryobacteraceae bacterium]
MLARIYLALTLVSAALVSAEEPSAAPTEPPKPATYTLDTGTKVPLTLINGISTKHSMPGDRVYLETVFPVLVNGKIVIPVGSFVAGTVTQIKKPGRVKGRGELYVRFDSLTLPNGVMRDFRARIGGLEGTAPGTLDRDEGKVTSEGNKKGDLETVGETTAAGASAGGLIGGLGLGHPGLGVGIGAAGGAAIGMIGVLLSRGPDAVLDKGTTVEMVLDRTVTFSASDLNFGNYQSPPVVVSPSPASSTTTTRSRFPF